MHSMKNYQVLVTTASSNVNIFAVTVAVTISQHILFFCNIWLLLTDFNIFIIPPRNDLCSHMEYWNKIYHLTYLPPHLPAPVALCHGICSRLQQHCGLTPGLISLDGSLYCICYGIKFSGRHMTVHQWVFNMWLVAIINRDYQSWSWHRLALSRSVHSSCYLAIAKPNSWQYGNEMFKAQAHSRKMKGIQSPAFHILIRTCISYTLLPCTHYSCMQLCTGSWWSGWG